MTLFAGDSLIVKRKLHVLYGSLEANEVETLEDEAYHAVAVVRRLLFAEVLDKFAGKGVGPRVIIVKDAKYVQQGGFP